MSSSIHLRLKGRLKPFAAEALRAFHRDWAFFEEVEEMDDPILEKAHRSLEPIFMGKTAQKGVFEKALEGDRLELDVTFAIDADDFEFFLEEFLPHALASLESGEFGKDGKMQASLSFDAKTKKVKIAAPETKLKAVPTPRDEDLDFDDEDELSEEDIAAADADWEALYPNLTPAKWRKNLALLLKLTADIELQKAVFVRRSKEAPIPVENTFDLTVFYFTVLNLENGTAHALRKGFLSAAEIELMKEFDTLFRDYVPVDFDQDAKNIADPIWVRITVIAGKLVKDLVPRLTP